MGIRASIILEITTAMAETRICFGRVGLFPVNGSKITGQRDEAREIKQEILNGHYILLVSTIFHRSLYYITI